MLTRLFVNLSFVALALLVTWAPLAYLIDTVSMYRAGVPL